MAKPLHSANDIESEIAEMRNHSTQTERWMDRRSLARMKRMEERDQDMRYAFEAGYRRGFEIRAWFIVALLGFLIALELVRALY